MKVILFKSSREDVSQPDKFQTALVSANYVPEIIPVITFNFCNLDALFRKLQSPQGYQGIIFSSPRTVVSIEKAILAHSSSSSDAKTLLKFWEDATKKIFCVGRATAECAQKLFPNSKNIVTSPQENAESLGRQIVEVLRTEGFCNNEQKPLFLFPAGNLKTDTLENILSSGNIGTDNLVVYETVENPELDGLVFNLIVDNNTPFVFFSPSGVQSVLKHGKDLILTKDRPLIAIGPTTRDSILKLEGVNAKNVFVCEAPSSEGVIKCLKGVDSKS